MFVINRGILLVGGGSLDQSGKKIADDNSIRYMYLEEIGTTLIG